jgi:hypothetical protein
MIKMGVPVNGQALYTPPAPVIADSLQTPPPIVDPQTGETIVPPPAPKTVNPDPKTTVSKFLNNLSTQNFKAAYEAAENPNWGSYDKFSNPNSGFGSVKNITVKNIAVKNIAVPYNKDNSANVNVTYDVTDKNGKVTALNVTYGLKAVNNTWKITTYKINN